jgi:hypothetical protein
MKRLGFVLLVLFISVNAQHLSIGNGEALFQKVEALNLEGRVMKRLCDISPSLRISPIGGSHDPRSRSGPSS